MQTTGWGFIILGLIVFGATMLVAVVDLGVRNQYFADGGALPWYFAVNWWSVASSASLCILGTFLVWRGRRRNALS